MYEHLFRRGEAARRKEERAVPEFDEASPPPLLRLLLRWHFECNDASPSTHRVFDRAQSHREQRQRLLHV